MLRLSGGGAAPPANDVGGAKKEAIGAAASGVDSLKSSAQRRAQQAKAAGKAERTGFFKTVGRVRLALQHPSDEQPLLVMQGREQHA